MVWLSFAAGIAFSAVVLLPVACVILAALGTHEAHRLADKGKVDTSGFVVRL